MMGFNYASTIFIANFFTTNFVAIAVELFEHTNDTVVNLAIFHQ